MRQLLDPEMHAPRAQPVDDKRVASIAPGEPPAHPPERLLRS